MGVALATVLDFACAGLICLGLFVAALHEGQHAYDRQIEKRTGVRRKRPPDDP